MKKLFLFAAVAGLGLVSASPPASNGGSDKPEGTAYPPCSRTVTDSCIQGHGRGTMRRHHGGYGTHHARHQAAQAAAADVPAPAAGGAAGARYERARLHRIRRAGDRG